MKKHQKIGVLSFLALTMAMGYGCETRKDTNKKVLLAQATPLVKTSNKNTVKIALLLDTSNSMDGLINQAKSDFGILSTNLHMPNAETKPDPNCKLPFINTATTTCLLGKDTFNRY
ncbi:hypothetical protein [Maribacter thermophilus]|uniref:hypothetical protein n=1 Tax=Maribacter thermophilus TaxID=1197874 RepID=UPI000A4B9B69|nr:hypothetical protein [Maribacter thermophilus]